MLFEDHSKIKFPQITEYNKDNISEIYTDINTEKICYIKYENIYVFVQPTEQFPWPVSRFIFDYEAILNNYAKQTRLTPEILRETNAAGATNDLIYKHIFIYTFRNKLFDSDAFYHYLVTNKFIGDVDDMKYYGNVILWRHSRIGKSVYHAFQAMFNNNIETIVKIIYKVAYDTMQLKQKPTEMIKVKPITN
jgi:hypothetical protein